MEQLHVHLGRQELSSAFAMVADKDFSKPSIAIDRLAQKYRNLHGFLVID